MNAVKVQKLLRDHSTPTNILQLHTTELQLLQVLQEFVNSDLFTHSHARPGSTDKV